MKNTDIIFDGEARDNWKYEKIYQSMPVNLSPLKTKVAVSRNLFSLKSLFGTSKQQHIQQNLKSSKQISLAIMSASESRKLVHSMSTSCGTEKISQPNSHYISHNSDSFVSSPVKVKEASPRIVPESINKTVISHKSYITNFSSTIKWKDEVDRNINVFKSTEDIFVKKGVFSTN